MLQLVAPTCTDRTQAGPSVRRAGRRRSSSSSRRCITRRRLLSASSSTLCPTFTDTTNASRPSTGLVVRRSEMPHSPCRALPICRVKAHGHQSVASDASDGVTQPRHVHDTSTRQTPTNVSQATRERVRRARRARYSATCSTASSREAAHRSPRRAPSCTSTRRCTMSSGLAGSAAKMRHTRHTRPLR